MSKLYLGVKKVDITPKVGCLLSGYRPDLRSTSVHDSLDATAFVFGYGDTTAVLVSATVCTLPKVLTDGIREQLQKELGIPTANIMLAATHTHSGPVTRGQYVDREYIDTVLAPGIIGAVKQATENMQPVKVGYACGDSLVGINRREPRANNQFVLGQCAWGCFDPRMTVVTFRGESGKTAASMVFYGCHGTSAGPNQEITQDWAGVMVRRLEAVSGAPAAFFNGALGDVGPRLTNGKTTGNIHLTEELGGVAAQDAVRIFQHVTQYADCDMKCATGQVKLPLKKRVSLEEAQRKLAEYDSSEGDDAAIKVQTHFEAVIRSYEDGYQEQECFYDEQIVLRIGTLVFVTFQREIFSEIAMRIQKEHKSLVVLPVAIVNDYKSYFPTQSQRAVGGFEVQMFETQNIQEHVDDIDYRLICQSLNHIEKII